MLECFNVTSGQEKIKTTTTVLFVLCCSAVTSLVSIIEQVCLLSLLALALCSACLYWFCLVAEASESAVSYCREIQKPKVDIGNSRLGRLQ